MTEEDNLRIMYEDEGSIEGTLEVLSVHGRLEVVVSVRFRPFFIPFIWCYSKIANSAATAIANCYSWRDPVPSCVQYARDLASGAPERSDESEKSSSNT